MSQQESSYKGILDMSAYYSELEKNYDSGKRDENAPKLQKLWFNAPPNHGTAQIVLYPSGHDGSFFKHLKDVRVVKFYNEKVNEDVDAWHRILQKSQYPELQPSHPKYTKENESLYDEVNGLFDGIDKRENAIHYNSFKSKYTWNVFFGKLIAMYDLKNQKNADVKTGGAPTFFCYPSYKFESKVKDGLDSLKVKGYGEINTWAPHFFNANEGKRIGLVSIIHKLPETGGYDTTIEFVFDGVAPAPGLPAIKIIPDDFLVTEDDKKLFRNSVIAFMGKMYDYENDMFFNRSIFLDIRNYLSGVIAEYDAKLAGGTTPSAVPAAVPPPAVPVVPTIPENGHFNPLAGVQVPAPSVESVPAPTASIPVPQPLAPPPVGVPPIPVPQFNPGS